MKWLVSHLNSLLREVLVIALATLVVFLLFAGVKPLVDRWRRGYNVEQVGRLPEAVVGMRVAVGPADMKNVMTTVIVVSPECRYCVSSSSLHAEIARRCRQRGLPVYLAVPSASNAKSYASQVGFGKTEIMNWSDLEFRVAGTPTVVLVDSRGVIRGIWAGRLGAREEAELLKIVENPVLIETLGTETEGALNLGYGELLRLMRDRPVTVLDIRERDAFKVSHIETAVNIPLRELPVRAPEELVTTNLQVVDCSGLPRARCEFALRELKQAGFQTTSVSTGTEYRSCRMTSQQSSRNDN